MEGRTVAPTNNSASPPDNTRPPSNGSTSTRSSPTPNPTTKCPGNPTPYTGAPARRPTSIHTTDNKIGNPHRRRNTACSNEDSSR